MELIDPWGEGGRGNMTPFTTSFMTTYATFVISILDKYAMHTRSINCVTTCFHCFVKRWMITCPRKYNYKLTFWVVWFSLRQLPLSQMLTSWPQQHDSYCNPTGPSLPQTWFDIIVNLAFCVANRSVKHCCNLKVIVQRVYTLIKSYYLLQTNVDCQYKTVLGKCLAAPEQHGCQEMFNKISSQEMFIHLATRGRLSKGEIALTANPGLKFNLLFQFIYFCTSVYFKTSEK
jgi:hypothetical protein